MGVVHLPDDVMRLIQEQVSMGRALDATEFVAAAAMRHAAALDDAEPDGALLQMIDEALIESAARRFTTVRSEGDENRLWMDIWSSVEGRRGGTV